MKNIRKFGMVFNMNKKTLIAIAILAFLVVAFSGVSVAASEDSKTADTLIESKSKNSVKMTVTSPGIKNGRIAPKYGMYGSVKDKNGIPRMSIPLTVKNAPKKTEYYAVYMYDNDVPWVHWLAVNYKSKTFTEDASRKKANSMKQGKNDFRITGYGGPTPPDKTHTYTIKVYALEKKLNLDNGFSHSQFNKAIKGKVLATSTIKGKYVK